MGVAFLIQTVGENSDFQIDPQDYVEKILATWPRSVISKYPILMALSVEILSEDDTSILVDLHSDLQTVSFGYVPQELFTEFIAWHRSYIPQAYRLSFYGDFADGDNVIELTINTTSDEIIEYINS